MPATKLYSSNWTKNGNGKVCFELWKVEGFRPMWLICNKLADGTIKRNQTNNVPLSIRQDASDQCWRVAI